MKLKLDLHTHCLEATNYAEATVELVGQIVDVIKERGLDGIAITEHWNKDYGFKVKQVVENHFNSEVIIIPGREIDATMGEQVVELYLPNNAMFRFWVHPYHVTGSIDGFGEIQGIEIDNALHNWEIKKEEIRRIAEKYDLLLLSNSDAHYLEDVGRCYNEIELETLYSHAIPL